MIVASATVIAVTTGLFTLLGVVLGGILTAMLERARERRQDEKYQRQARLLLAEELIQICTSLDQFVQNAKYPASLGTPAAPFLPQRMWLEYRATLSLGENEKLFRLLSRVYTGIAMLEAEILEGGQPLAPAPSDLIDSTKQQLQIAAFVYKHLTGEDWDAFKQLPSFSQSAAGDESNES